MTSEFDPLERELSALRPQMPSARLAERIAERLEGEPPVPCAEAKAGGTRSVRTAFYLLAPAGIVAAVLLIAVALWLNGKGASEAEFPIDSPQPLLANALDDSLPSIWSYRQALVSPGDLDELLDDHARRPRVPDDPAPTCGFGSLNPKFETRLGGL